MIFNNPELWDATQDMVYANMQEDARVLAEENDAENDAENDKALFDENFAILQEEEQKERLIRNKVLEIPIPETFVEELEIPTNSFCVCSVEDPVEKLSCYTNGCAVTLMHIPTIGNIVMHTQYLAEDSFIDEMLVKVRDKALEKLGVSISDYTFKVFLANSRYLEQLKAQKDKGVISDFSEELSSGSILFIDNVTGEVSLD